MEAYRLLTGNDNSDFCHKITVALNAGWELHGPPTMTFDATTGTVICGQAVCKHVPGKTYEPGMKLGSL